VNPDLVVQAKLYHTRGFTPTSPSSLIMKLRNRRFYPGLFLLFAVAGICALVVFAPKERQLELVLGWLGASGGFIGFLYSQHLQETQLFKQLFTDFNRRYDTMNEQLEAIRRRPAGAPLQPDHRRRLIDYFNLCAEEYLFFRSGYIDHDVWKSWARGMLYFAQDPEIRGLWDEELKTDSYYGFRLEELAEA
jgi:hypothetical protein